MTLTEQIFWGSLTLGGCFAVEIALLVVCNVWLEKLSAKMRRNSVVIRAGTLIACALGVIVLAHTIQVWIWAGAWVFGDVMPDWNSAIYFSLVTYTTLGYGDIVLGPDLRIFAAFAAVTGLLAFGLSTAYLVAMMTRMFEHEGKI
ncbi:voltage-gated potassium channel [Falsiruegeria litorea R37]|uniref:Voltage-gated potassium channel n=1 Tax=Falsiruegeria litorea R37 TaxID=1200284 RepID=A0A1Y5SJF2_9RHOB|nr:potassium channel family protein [Falsiruegeria litorea]SLN42052.1 voltage-gated potassium channel [Falsiruegeria litorea R37]